MAAASLWGRKSLDSWFNKSGYGLYNGRWSSIRANKYDFIMEPNAKLGHVRSEARLWSGQMCAGICGDTGGAGASVATGSRGGDKLIDSWRNNGTSSLFHRHCLTPGWLRLLLRDARLNSSPWCLTVSYCPHLCFYAVCALALPPPCSLPLHNLASKS